MSNKIRTKSFKDKLKTAALPQRVVPVCLRGDLFSEVQMLANQLQAVQEKEQDTDRFIKNPEAKRLADEIERLRDEMVEGTEDFVIRALPKTKWNDLRTEHSPREGEPRDALTGVNVDTFNAELLPLAIVSPEMDADDWAAVLELLSDYQYEELVDAAWAANRATVSVPFSQAASRIRKSGSESKPPND